jgi:hypothetical protein
LEHAQQNLTQYVDLPGGAVARVHLDAAVVRGELAALGGEGVGAEIVLQPAEKRGGRCR